MNEVFKNNPCVSECRADWGTQIQTDIGEGLMRLCHVFDLPGSCSVNTQHPSSNRNTNKRKGNTDNNTPGA